MIKLDEIRTELIRMLQLKTEVKHVTGEDIPISIFPFLHVQLIPISTMPMSRNLVNRSILVDITYCEEEKTKNHDLYKMSDLLDEIFLPAVELKERFITIRNTTPNIVDDTLHYIFQLEFLDETDEKLEEKMKQVEISLNRRGIDCGYGIT